MSGDVKLEETSVIVEASTLACHSTDLVLDHPDRRMSTTGSRRALVHDFNDGLTLNWANDYPGGVTIKGNVCLETITPAGIALKVATADLQLDHPDRRTSSTGARRALVHDFHDGLTLNWDQDYPGGVTIKGNVCLETIAPPGMSLKVATADLQLDRSERRKNATPNRRALVHNFNDGLTLNWANDYPGGVTINGEVHLESGLGGVTVNGKLKATHLQAGNVHIHEGASPDSGPSPLLPKIHSHALKVYSDTIIAETITGTAASPVTTTLDLVAELRALREEVDILKTKVAALES